MRITNKSERAVALGGSVQIPAGGSIFVKPDAMRLMKSPLVKAYIADGTLVTEGPSSKKPMTAKAEKTDTKAKLTA